MPVIDAEIPLDPDVEHAWHAWLEVTKARCHINYELEGGRLDTHIASCLENSMITADRVTKLGHPCPRKILEVGSSTGFNCLALSHLYPDAEIYGIEPDNEAVLVANSMAAAAGKNKVYFQQGVGESLPYENEEFDLIICLTVIEHVCNVENVISEMARVLSPDGILRLEAPNYVWPYEPHLSLWCIPLLGKKFARFMALIQGKSKNVAYLDHLQFVTPGRLESAFKKNGLVWENLVQVKLEQVFEGDSSQIKAYTRIARLMRIPAKLGLGRILVKIIMGTRLYPSVLYAVKKHRMYNLLHRLHDRLPINRDYLAALVTGYGLMAVIIVIQLVLIPLYLTHLGKEKFGVLAMIMVANNYAAIGITWLSGSMARVLAERAAVDDREGFREAYAFSKAVYVLYAVIALCIFWLAAPWLLKNALADEEIFYAIVLSSVYFVLAYEYNADRQAFMARHWQARGNLREVVGQIVFAGFVAFGLYQGMGLPGVVLAQIAGIVCTRLLAWAHWRKDEYGLGWAWKFTDARTLWRRVSGRVGRHYVVYGVLLLTLQADALIIGWLAGPEIAANYYLIWRIPEVFILLLWRIPSSYAPHLIAMDARHEYDSLSQNYRKGLYSVSILAGLAALIYGIFGNPIVHLWLGDDAPAGQLPYAIAALAMFFISIARWPAEVAYALMNTKPLVRVVAIELAFKLVLIAVLFSAIGYLSPIVAVCLVHLLGISYLYMWLGKETISAHIHSRII